MCVFRITRYDAWRIYTSRDVTRDTTLRLIIYSSGAAQLWVLLAPCMKGAYLSWTSTLDRNIRLKPPRVVFKTRIYHCNISR